MSLSRLGTKNSMFGKSHTTKTKTLISVPRKGKIYNNETKRAISVANGTPIYLYAACLNNHTDAFCLIQKFSDIREVGKDFNINHSTASNYLKSGKLLSRKGEYYKFSYSKLNEINE